MNIDTFKNEFRQLRAKHMDLPTTEISHIDELIEAIRRQDREDEHYILRKKVLPMAVGLALFTIVVMICPITNTILFTGCLLLFAGLASAMILYLLEYKDITKETFDLSLSAFLKHKQSRLSSWRTTPARYNVLYAVFILGVVMMIAGNTGLIKTLDTTENVMMYIGANLFLFLISWGIGEYFFRKRHHKEHKPLIRLLKELTQEIEEDE